MLRILEDNLFKWIQNLVQPDIRSGHDCYLLLCQISMVLHSQSIKQLTNEQQKSPSILSCAALEKWIQIMNQLISLIAFFYTREWKLAGQVTDSPRSYFKIHHTGIFTPSINWRWNWNISFFICVWNYNVNILNNIDRLVILISIIRFVTFFNSDNR